ncbi:stage V sporulation protein AE [Alicyclobacillus vulcanalis]|uniref:Stage V sporulation protein AE n=1 Tax=Alicyclobacillus vulcanalis TaxID=252246 RepID=A0A1N7KLI1_9BACL|nr:stage V sporulation protein AE [Alicyclobacillus vulcanalis]SIS62376.1 stage V sporulation protein AE [Alicyclobacillus vulcanalis]
MERSDARPRRVIVVTDGDGVAARALSIAAKRTGCSLLRQSRGNPTRLSGVELVRCIQAAPSDPVILMLDDNGDPHEAAGESALRVLDAHPAVEIAAILAVASHTKGVRGTAVDFSVDRRGRRVDSAVDKDGYPTRSHVIAGDTLDALQGVDVPLIVGIGDIGKMGGCDAPGRGAPVTTSAVEWVLMELYWRAGNRHLHPVQRPPTTRTTQPHTMR